MFWLIMLCFSSRLCIAFCVLYNYVTWETWYCTAGSPCRPPRLTASNASHFLLLEPENIVCVVHQGCALSVCKEVNGQTLGAGNLAITYSNILISLSCRKLRRVSEPAHRVIPTIPYPGFSTCEHCPAASL